MWRLIGGSILLLAGCAGPTGPSVSTLNSSAVSTVAPVPAPEGNCREYRTTITVGGDAEEGYGQACQQPDGTWQITRPPGETAEAAAPQQQRTILYPAYPSYAYNPWWGPPFGAFGAFGFGFGHRHHHHHHW
jgi:hypothetical protein